MKPKYNFFKNSSYAMDGIKAMIKTQTSFKIELIIIIPAIILALFLSISFILKILCICSLILILAMESLNSAIEACVDLYTNEFHPLAKIAKDCGSSAVFFSISIAAIIWIYTFYELFYG